MSQMAPTIKLGGARYDSCEAFADYMLNTYVAPDSRFLQPYGRLQLHPLLTAEELPRTNNGCESFQCNTETFPAAIHYSWILCF